MFNKANPARDAFTFSLGGLRTVASFTFAPAIAHDRVNSVRENNNRGRPIWSPTDSRAALDNR